MLTSLTSPSQKPIDGGQIAGIVVGSVLGAVILVILIGIFVFWFLGWIPSHDKEAPSSKSLNKPPCPKANILLICCSTNQLHRIVVQRFVSYLSAQCHCSVTLPPDNLTVAVDKWLLDQSKLVSKVVIVHSADDELQALHWMQTYLTSNHVWDSEAGALISFPDLFTAAICLSVSKLLNKDNLMHVYFEYTDSKYFCGARCGRTFFLMDDFNEFMNCVHCGDVQTWPPIPEELHDAISNASDNIHDTNSFFWIPPDMESVMTSSTDQRLNELGCEPPEDSGCDVGGQSSSFCSQV
jgi:hypothetical protein